MARRITSGIVGGPVLGLFAAQDNTFRSVGVNDDIILDPNGTGEVQVGSDLHVLTQSVLKLGDGASSYVGLKGPASGDGTDYVMPAADGTDGFVLKTNGSGVLSWAAETTFTVDDAATNTAYPVLYSKITGGSAATPEQLDTYYTAASKITFNPGSGTLTATALDGNLTSSNVTITGGTINSTTIGGSTPAAATFTTLSTTGNTDIGNASSDTLTITASIDSNVIPSGTRNLGSSGSRWANLYVNDLSLSNGIGDYTIVEGVEDLFLYNNNNGKVYKFLVEEVDPSVAPPKKDVGDGE